MMKEQLYIDGVDVYEAYGLYCQSYDDFVGWPSLKEVPTSSWHEEDGIRADLSNPKLDGCRRTLRLNGRSSEGLIDKLSEALKASAYHTVNVLEIGRSYTLRLVSQKIDEVAGDIYTLTLVFNDDFPLNGYTYEPPTSELAGIEECAIDGNNLSDYGCRVLKGTRVSWLGDAEVKEGLAINSEQSAGISYDNGALTFTKRGDATMKLMLRASSREELWRNYDALLYDLVRPGARLVSYGNTTRAAHYVSSRVVRLTAVKCRPWLEFDVVLRFVID